MFAPAQINVQNNYMMAPPAQPQMMAPFAPMGFGSPNMGMDFGYNNQMAALSGQLMMMEMMLELMMLMMMGQGLNGGGANPMGQNFAPSFGNDSSPISGSSPNSGNSAPVSQSNSGNSAAPSAPASNVPTTGETDKVRNFIDVAKSQQGAPYVFGASGNGKYDCSGLVSWALNKSGVKVPRLTARGYQDMFKNSAVTRDQLKPGDLVFFWSPNDRGIPKGKASHIEIYLGNGMTMGTDNPKEGAKVEPINWSTFIGGARVPALYN